MARSPIAVPSIGSNLMHLTLASHRYIIFQNCSTLNRVEPHASVRFHTSYRTVRILQYPQSGRTSCIQQQSISAIPTYRIAVPSIGSNLMHHDLRRGQESGAGIAVPSIGSNLMHPFSVSPSSLSSSDCSTLNRVEPHASPPRPGSPGLRLKLQYPQSGRTSCIFRFFAIRLEAFLYCSTLNRVEPHASLMRRINSVVKFILQYPQSGRTSCIKVLLRAKMPMKWNCSTLNRVEPHASEVQQVQAFFVLLLQYPQSGRTSCIISKQQAQFTRVVSIAVPSIGSNLMHPPVSCPGHTEPLAIAVPSIGSNLMHPAGWYTATNPLPAIAVPSIGSNLMHLDGG